MRRCERAPGEGAGIIVVAGDINAEISICSGVQRGVQRTECAAGATHWTHGMRGTHALTYAGHTDSSAAALSAPRNIVRSEPDTERPPAPLRAQLRQESAPSPRPTCSSGSYMSTTEMQIRSHV
jgi:hypothetical protein